jgi:hypothetical protein
MPVLLVSGWYKMLSPPDFKSQIWQGYLIESFCFTLPVLLLQGINNNSLDRWELKTYGFLFVMLVALGLNFKSLKLMKEATEKMEVEANRKKEMAEMQRKKQRGPGAEVADVLVKDERKDKVAKE